MRATPTKVPAEAPALLPASVIGAPFEVSAPVPTMLRVPVRAIALPAPPLIVASAIVKVCAVPTSWVNGVTAPTAPPKVMSPVVLAVS